LFIIQRLDQLKERLWSVYGEEIIRQVDWEKYDGNLVLYTCPQCRVG
jgi:hypothetical protein